MIFNPSQFKTQYIKDTNHTDDETVKYLGKEFKLGDLRSMLDSFEERRYNALIFYDDILQYTSLGIFEKIINLYDIEIPIPVQQFLNRTEPEGKDYLVKLLKPFDISEVHISSIESEYYKDIIKSSPRSKNFRGIYTMRELFSSITFVFKYEFKEIEQIVNLFSTCYNTANYIPINVLFRKNKSEYDFLKSRGRQDIDVLFVNNAAKAFNVIEETGMSDVMLVSKFKHCGLNDDEKAALVFLDNMGPNRSYLFYITEGL